MIDRFYSIGGGRPSVRECTRMGLSTSAQLESIEGQSRRRNTVAVTFIKNDISKSDGAIIMSGQEIGPLAVIGTDIATCDVPPCQTVGGTPARMIRPLFAAPIAAGLRAVAWKEYPFDALRD